MKIYDYYGFMIQVLRNMQARGKGVSRKAAKQNGTDRARIHADDTFATYGQQAKYYAKWLDEKHPDVHQVKQMRRLVREYLLELQDTGYAASTITTAAAALNKIFGIHPGDKDYFECPKRRREDFTRSRHPVKTDERYRPEYIKDICDFCDSTGCRRNVLEKLQGRDLYDKTRLEREKVELEHKVNRNKDEEALLRAIRETMEFFPDFDYFILHHKDKGGRFRIAPIIGPCKKEVIQRMRNTPALEFVWKVPQHLDIHAHRAVYANVLYQMYARPIEEIKDKKELYICRKDRKGTKLDKTAMGYVSVALGHGSGRTVFADYYLREGDFESGR